MRARTPWAGSKAGGVAAIAFETGVNVSLARAFTLQEALREKLVAGVVERRHGIHEKVNKERQRLWHALHELTKLEGGKVVSPPYHSPLRIQLDPENTTLIPKLVA